MAKASKKSSSKKTTPKSHKKFIVESAIGAGKILLKYFRGKLQIEVKPGAGIVTQADKAAEAYLMKRIRKEYPESSIITEESGRFMKDHPMCWILDPLDGTSNFAHGFPWFCVSIGLHVNGQAEAGCIYNPVNGEMFLAERGKGAFLNGKAIKVSPTKTLEGALLGTGFYYSKGEALRSEMQIFQKVCEEVLAVRRPGSAALDLAYVACGRYDGFWERGLSPWDVAAGYLLVEEAGGKVTNYQGNPTGAFDKEALATNGHVHPRLIELISNR
jgi:myo-inositol-1(or 4)-monophosphatase